MVYFSNICFLLIIFRFFYIMKADFYLTNTTWNQSEGKMVWNNIKLGKKIMIGIGLVLALMLVIGGWSWSGISGIVHDATELSAGNKLVGILLQREIDHLNWAGEVNKLLTDKNVTRLKVQTDHTRCGFGKWLYGAGRKDAERLMPVLKNLFSAIEGPHQSLHQSAVKIGNHFKVADEALPTALANKEVDHLSWSEKVQSAILQKDRQLSVQLDHTKCAFGQMLYGNIGKEIAESDPKLASLLEEIKTPHEQLHKSGERINIALRNGNFQNAQEIYLSETAGILSSTRNGLKKLQNRALVNLQGVKTSRAVYATETQPALAEVQSLLTKMKQVAREHVISEDQMLEKAMNTRMAVLFISAIAILGGILLAILITRAITSPIKKTVKMMMELKNGNFKSRSNISGRDEIGLMAKAMDECGEELQQAIDEISAIMNGVNKGDLARRVEVDCKGELDVLKTAINQSLELLGQTIDHGKNATEQVNTSAAELSQSAQSLASGASQQAASLEEISSSMAEIGSRAKANDENALQAKLISDEAIDDVTGGNKQMESMLLSMKEIDKNSSNVMKVIKVIDEIAFQTNLLALNAAVEAARAGKYGKGFAVVAEEVRNLAGRSAKAAKETNELIEKSVTEVSNGVKKADETAAVLESISSSVVKVNDLVGEITAASNEQSNSIGEVNNGLSMMNDVVQQNSSIAEETAAASEELSSQSTELQNLMDQFQTGTKTLISDSNKQPGNNKSILPKITLDEDPIEQQLEIGSPRKFLTLDEADFGKY
jgi:methyl-accepting chemotaxis protein